MENFVNKVVGFILVLIFFLSFFDFVNSKELVCSKKLGECYLRKVFYQEQILDKFDLDFVKYATCKNRQSKNDDQKFYVKTENREVEVFKTDFCHLKEKSFNEYLKNNVDEYKMREITVKDVILLILSVVIFIPAGVVMLNGKVEVDKTIH